MTPQQKLEFAEVNVPPTTAVQVPGESGADAASISSAVQACFSTPMNCVERHGLIPAGPPRVRYFSFDPEGTSFQVAMPILPPQAPVEDPEITIDVLPAAKQYRFTHRGAYAGLAQTYGEITEFMKSKGLMQTDDDWANYMPMAEEYPNDPSTTPQAELLTYIYLPAKS